DAEPHAAHAGEAEPGPCRLPHDVEPETAIEAILGGCLEPGTRGMHVEGAAPDLGTDAAAGQGREARDTTLCRALQHAAEPGAKRIPEADEPRGDGAWH